MIYESSVAMLMIKLQVRKRERMAKLREEIAVQKAKETELNKTIHITGSFAHYMLLCIYMWSQLLEE